MSKAKERIAELKTQIKATFDREAESQKRHDLKMDRLEAEVLALRQKLEKAVGYVEKMAAQKLDKEMEYPMNADWRDGFTLAVTDARTTLAELEDKTDE